jgi:hypothetical protein
MTITEEQWEALRLSGARAPEPSQRWSSLEIAKALISGRWLAFSVPGGIIAVEKIGTRLYVRALNITGFGFRMRKFRDDMDRLATDMMCDTVETICFDERLARATMKIRASVEAWTMVWQVEGRADGQ